MSNQSSLPPSSTRLPPTGSGNGKYLVIMLLLGGGIAGLIAWRHSQDESAAQVMPAASASAALAVAHASHEEVADIPPPPPAIPDATPDTGGPKVASTNSGGGDVCSPHATCNGSAGSELQAALAFRSKTSHKCYDEALAQDSTLKGKVSINVRVATNGQVCSASVGSNEVANPSVASCIASRFRQGARLPSPTGGCVDVNVPMNLVPPH